MRISQFQKYSQKENTVTNNVLLMLSRLNDLSAIYYKSMIDMLNNEESAQPYYPQPAFKQQVGMGEGIMDGFIELKPSKIVIETKLEDKESIRKLIKYAAVFKEECQNILWHLSSVKYDENEVEEINKKLEESYPNLKIQFNNLLFSDLLENLEGVCEEYAHDMELRLLFDDFSKYCNDNGLISNEKYKLLLVPTGRTFEWNKEHKMYFCPKQWHRQRFTFFGLYKSKSVRAIYKIENIIIADYDSNTEKLTIHTDSKEYTEEQKVRLKKGLKALGQSHSGFKYYIFPENKIGINETDFRKDSKGGIQGHRYRDLRYDLKDSLNDDDYENVESVAQKLKEVKWK